MGGINMETSHMEYILNCESIPFPFTYLGISVGAN